MTTDNITHITLPNGKVAPCKQIDFEVIKENWNEYKTSSGVIVKLKSVVGKMFLVIDEKGDIVGLPEGEPNIIVRSTNLLFINETGK